MKHIYLMLLINFILVGNIQARKMPPTGFNPLPDTIFCKGKTFVLDAGAGFDKYLWNTGDTTQTITANQTGWYGITTTDINGTYQDTVFVSFLNVYITPRDSVITPSQTVILSTDTGTKMVVPVIYLVGSFNSWDPTTSLPMGSITNNGYYEMYRYIPAGSYQVKFITAQDWTHTVYGDGGTAGTLSSSLSAGNINFNPTVSGVYKIGCNTTTKTYDIVAINTLGVVGDAAFGWGTDLPLQYDQNTGFWVGQVALNTGHIKFRANNAWTINYGGLNTDSSLVSYGSDLLVPQAGNYLVTLDFNDPLHFVYHLTNVNNPLLLNPTLVWSTSETTSSITVSPSVTTKYTVQVSNGYTIVSDSITFYVPAYLAGNVVSPKGDNVTGAVIKVSGNGYIKSDSVLTDAQGNFLLNIMTGDSYLLKPHKDNDINKSNGVTTLDLALIQSHILGKNNLNSPYKIIAADVNGDGKVTTLDLVYIKRLILGLDTTFTNNKTGEKRLWTFTGANDVFADPLHPFPYQDSGLLNNVSNLYMNINIIGMKLGDVNWDWNPALSRMPKAAFIKQEYEVYPQETIDK